MERIQKIIAQSGYCSRRKAEELIVAGKVKLKGVTGTKLRTVADGNDTIEVDGYTINDKQEKVYVLLNKPRGVVTSTKDDKHRKVVTDLINIPTRIYPVGRLDYDTTGVLLLTNDGELTNELLHPSNHIEKVYIAKIKGILTPGHRKTLENGVIIDGIKTAPAKVKIKRIDKKNNTSVIEIMIHEGRNHQIKKMFESVGFPVLKLKREREFIFDLKGLKSGEYRRLTPKEVAIVYSLNKNKRA